MPAQRCAIRLLATVLAAAVVGACANEPMNDQPAHHTDDGFRNNYGSPVKGFGLDFLAFLWELQTGDWEPVDVERVAPELEFLHANREQATATWLGHASFLIQLGGRNILTDPILSERASPLPFAGPTRLQAPGIALQDLPPIEVVVISHDHYDHLDLPTLEKLQERDAPLLVVPLGLGEWLRDRGFEKVAELDWWQRQETAGLRVHAVPVQHFSGRGLRDRNQRLWAGYVLEADGLRVFFAGDTGYSPDFADIGARFAPIDLALIPIGAYEPRDFMKPVHVNPEEAVRIHQDVGARQSIGMHWGTFRLTTEPLDEPPRRLARALDEAGIDAERFVTIPLGATRPIAHIP